MPDAAQSLPKFRLIGTLPTDVTVGDFSYLIHIDDTGVRSSSYLSACGIDTWILASILPSDARCALEKLGEGFTPPLGGKSLQICEALVRQGVLELVP